MCITVQSMQMADLHMQHIQWIAALLNQNISNFNFKLYLFYNNNTRLQIGHEVILLGGE